MTARNDIDADDLRHRLQQPARRWLVLTARVIIALALALNLANMPGIYRTAAKVHNWMGALWMFGSPGALVLAIACTAVRRPITWRRALVCLALAILSALGFLFSYAATQLLSYDTWFGHPTQ
jgi:hypothetical protein